MLRYAVVGTGAVGGFYGIRLAAAGARVQFLVRRGGEHVRASGLHLSSPQGDLRVTDARVADDWTQVDRADVLLVAVKATANSAVIEQLARHVDRVLAPDGAVLLIQNGIGAEAAYAAAAPGRAVLGGLAFLCAHREGVGQVRHLDFGALTLAAYTATEEPAGVSPLMRRLCADLAASGTACVFDDDLIRARWRKLLWNIPFNPLSVILDATTDQLMADEHSVALIRGLMAEVLAVADAEGRALPAGVIDDLLAATAAMAPYATSMMLDARAGRPMEVQAVLAEPLRRAARVGVPMPGVSVLHQQLAFLDARHRR